MGPVENIKLKLLKEAVPTLSRVAVLTTPGDRTGPNLFRRAQEAAAQELGLTLQFYVVREPTEFAGAFTAMTTARAEALYVSPAPFWDERQERVVALAAQHRLPAVYPGKYFVEVGGLMSYGVNHPATYRRLGSYVDRILKGAKPGDLPVEQPSTFQLVINLKTAKALGITIPPTLLIQADEVIE